MNDKQKEEEIKILEEMRQKSPNEVPDEVFIHFLIKYNGPATQWEREELRSDINKIWSLKLKPKDIRVRIEKLLNTNTDSIMRKWTAGKMERKLEIFENSDDKENFIFDEINEVTHIDGIPFLGGKKVLLKLYFDRLIISDTIGVNSYKIKLNSIIDIKVKTETEISEEERNVVARAVVGGLLFGGVGAIVGGMSGLQRHLIKTPRYFLTMRYISKEGGEKSLMFVGNPNIKFELDEFLDAVLYKIQKDRPRNKEMEL